MELTPPVARYEQVARQLRRQILDGTYPPASMLPSGADIGRRAGVSQNMVQRAFEILEREGLVSKAVGTGTKVLFRRCWTLEFGSPGAADGPRVGAALVEASAGQPAVRAFAVGTGADGILVTLTVESADIGGAVTVGLPVARMALGGLVITRISAAECQTGDLRCAHDR